MQNEVRKAIDELNWCQGATEGIAQSTSVSSTIREYLLHIAKRQSNAIRLITEAVSKQTLNH